MDFKKWETIILEWVNCLKLSNAVKSLKDLRDGCFYSSLIKLLTPDESDTSETCLTTIVKFLKKQYPNFNFQYESDLNLEDLLEIDLFVISSLLLHYCCIYDRRDTLTSPLCHKLSKTTQICIRAFLENIKNEITKEEFFETIERCICTTKPKTVHVHTLPSADSFFCGSPLQDLLQTPPSKFARLQEKDREISKLRTEIDLERYEKTDLQDELRVQKERNKKLNKQMGDKAAEIIRLRSEIADIENRSLPHCQNDESCELQRRLRSEIGSLEQYVTQLQNEQEVLYNERDTIKDKLRRVEGQCTIWYDKAISTEKNFDNLLEQHQQQEVELRNLRAHCTELSALLEELQAVKRSNESSVEVDSSIIENSKIAETGLSCEDLACAVVEVQLRDVQKENVELRNILRDNQENAKTLSEELKSTKAFLEELQADYEILKTDNEDLLQKVSILRETQATLQSTRQELEQSALTIGELSKCNECLNQTIGSLRLQLNETEATLATFESSNDSLSKNLKALQHDYTSLEGNLTNRNENCHALENQVNIIQAEYKQLLENYNKTNFNLQALTVNFNELELNMEQNLQNLERFAFGDSCGLDLKNRTAAFTEIFSHLEKTRLQETVEKKVLTDSVSDFEELVSKLRSDLVVLKEKEVVNLQERQTLCNNLKCAEQRVSVLENTIADHVEKIEDLNRTIGEMSATISEFETLKEVVEEKENTISGLEVANRSLEIKLSKSNEELAQSRMQQEDLQQSLDCLERIKSDFETKVGESERKLAANKANEENLNKTIAELQALTCVFEGQILEKTDELAKCKQDEENLQQTLADLKYQLFEANNKIARQKCKVELLEKDKFEQERQFQENVKVLNVEIEGYQIKINELEMDLLSSRSNYVAAQKDLAVILNTKHELQEEIDICRQDFGKRVAILETTTTNLEQTLQVATEQERDLRTQLNAKSVECDALKHERDQNMSQYVELVKRLEDALEKLTLQERKCQDQDNIVSKSNQDLLLFKLEVEEKKQRLETLEVAITERNSQIQRCEEQMTALDLQNTELREKITELQSECSLLQTLKENLEQRSEELECNAWKIVSELSTKNEQLDDLAGRYKQHQEKTEAEIARLETALAESSYELEQLKKAKTTLAVENEKQIDSLQGNILQLNEVIRSLNNREMQYIDEMRTTKDELSDTIGKYTEALQERQEVEAESETQINNLTENLHELIEKYNNLDKTHADTIAKFSSVQRQLDDLENDKLRLEANLQEQKSKYEGEYSSRTASFNMQIAELVQRESELKAELKETKRALETSRENNDNLNDNFNKMCAELAQIREEKTNLCQKMSKFGDVCKELKNAFGSLRLTHIQFVDENRQNLNELQTELAREIGTLAVENTSLKDYIKNLEEHLSTLRDEQFVMNTIHADKMEAKEDATKALEEEIEVCKAHINVMQEEKKLLEEQIYLEKGKVNEYKKELDGSVEANRIEIEEYEANVTKLKCANSILEAGKDILQSEIDALAEKIQQLEETKVSDETKHAEDVETRDETIRNLTAKIDVLQTQVAENVNKNHELMLELCSVNESLDSLTMQHRKLQQVLSEEQKNYTKKLLQLEAEGANKQDVLEGLQTENKTITQEISLAKSEVETLKEKLKTYLMERQALELEIRAANGKLLGQDSVVRRQEATISEANSKLLAKLEEILELEKAKRTLQEKVEDLCIELDKAKRSRDEIMESQAKLFKDTENNLIRAHESATEAKNDLLKRLELAENEKVCEKQLRGDIEKLLEGEKVAKEILEIRVLELVNEKSKFSQVFSLLKHNIQCLTCVLNEKPVKIWTDNEAKELNMDDVEYLNLNIGMIQEKIVQVMEQNRTCIEQISTLEREKSEIEQKIEKAIDEKAMVAQEKEELFNNYNILCNEKSEREQELKRFKDIQMAHDVLTAKYEQLIEFSKNSESVRAKNVELEQTLAALERKTSETYNTYKKFAGHSITYKIAIEKLITERNVLEGVLNNLKQHLASIQTKVVNISDEREHARVAEQVQAFEVIAEDVQKQFLRISRKVHEAILTLIQIPANVYDSVVSGKAVKAEDLFEKINFDEELEKITDCRDRANDLLDQLVTCEGCINTKITKPQKENVLRSSNNANVEVKVRDEELKKRNTLLKQRLTLAENAKSNLEKKIKQLRQENKTLSERTDSTDSDFGYKTLLQQHIQAKEEYEKTLSECKAQYNKLLQEHEDYRANHKFIPDQIKYEKEMKTEHDVKLEKETVKLREAYGNLMSDNSKLELENATMRKLLDDRTSQLSELKLIKEAYEKLLEENNKLRMELDTIKYKRNRDREALFEALKKDRSETQKIQEVRNEYEAKLEKMKDKMVQLYREEINKEVQKHQKEQNEKVLLVRTIEQLKNNLQEMKLERNRVADQQHSQSRDFESCSSGDSFFMLPDSSQSRSSTQSIKLRYNLPVRGLDDPVMDRSLVTRRKGAEDRKCATLPRSIGMSVIEEDTVLKRNTLTSVQPALSQNLEMEDEDEDLFNNKYLTDLKEGRCVLPTGRESNASRLSELKWRNSLCLPHLKSSYPAETQFSSPGQFKEEDLKSGLGDLDDSMSTRLIPGEKPRKKDIGTTSYKRPGPPTPSKNGGRVSLQGNEPHLRDVLREQQNESKTPKRTTPSRLKALFMGRNSSARDNSENQPGTPRSKRLSIFRKPK